MQEITGRLTWVRLTAAARAALPIPVLCYPFLPCATHSYPALPVPALCYPFLPCSNHSCPALPVPALCYPFLPCSNHSCPALPILLPIPALCYPFLPVLGIFNVYTDVEACACTRALYEHLKRVCTESWLKGKKNLPHRGFEPPGLWVPRSTS